MQSTCRLAGSWTEGPSHCQRSRIVATMMLRSSFMRKSQVASRWLSRRTQQSRYLHRKLSKQDLFRQEDARTVQISCTFAVPSSITAMHSDTVFPSAMAAAKL